MGLKKKQLRAGETNGTDLSPDEGHLTSRKCYHMSKLRCRQSKIQMLVSNRNTEHDWKRCSEDYKKEERKMLRKILCSYAQKWNGKIRFRPKKELYQ